MGSKDYLKSLYEFNERIWDHLLEEEAIHDLLRRHGPGVIRYMTKNESLRLLAARTGLSPTYLSQVASRKTVISKSAMQRLIDDAKTAELVRDLLQEKRRAASNA